MYFHGILEFSFVHIITLKEFPFTMARLGNLHLKKLSNPQHQHTRSNISSISFSTRSPNPEGDKLPMEHPSILNPTHPF